MIAVFGCSHASMPVVGVSCSRSGSGSVLLPTTYTDALRSAGAVPLVIPTVSDEAQAAAVMEVVDGIVFSGGEDVNPAWYGESVWNETVEIDSVRDRSDSLLARAALACGKPVLAICRGSQLMNVILGGSLYQDLPSQHPTETEHHMSPPYDRPAHQVEICKGTPLFDLIQTERMDVNSYHHQAVRDKAPALQTMAVSEDGLIEAVCLPERPFVWAVQWHPELSWRTDEKSRRIFEAFVGRCASERNRCEKNE